MRLQVVNLSNILLDAMLRQKVLLFYCGMWKHKSINDLNDLKK